MKKNLLDLFSGTHSVGICAKNYKRSNTDEVYNVVSLDRDLDSKSKLYNYVSNNHIKEDIMTWNYKIYPVGYFHIITASPVCVWWSCMRRAVLSNERIQNDINELGKPMLDKVIEIIEYFKPNYYWIENPQTGSMKEYIKEKHPKYYKNKIVDYCSYDDNIGYMKRTIFFTNININPLLCKKDKCPNKINGRHKINIAYNMYVFDNGKKIFTNTKELRQKYKDYEKHKQKTTKNKYDRYKIPFNLINDLLENSQA